MFSDSPLIVIDEYPIPSIKPFMNPICKDTYEALPKIYGRKGKKRYLYNIQEIIRHQHTTFHRQCCHIEVEQPHRPSSDQHQKKRANMSLNLEAIPKNTENGEHTGKKHCICGRNLEKKGGEVGATTGGQQATIKIKHETARPHAKLQKILLPHLKEIDEVREAQSKHKVCQLTSNPIIEDPKSKVNTIESRILLESRLDKLKELKECRQSRIGRTQSIQTDPVPAKLQTPSTTPVELTQTKIKEKQQPITTIASTSRKRLHTEPRDPNKPYYEYLENDPKLKQLQKQQKKGAHSQHSRQIHNLRRGTPTEEQALSISSFTIKNQHSASTVFHHFKKKQNSRNSMLPLTSSQKTQKSYKLFQIPKPEEYQSFLKEYKPLNPEFDLKALIRKKDFIIVPGESFVYFGQVSGQMKHGNGILLTEKELFEGTFHHNAKVAGAQKNKDGVYWGQFEGGKRSGEGKFAWNNGEQFQGEWREGKKNGSGKWQSPKGDSYEGEWRDNKQNGKGCFVHFGGSKYRGYFKDFLKHGKGEEDFNNGDKYSGFYQQGKPHGYGKYTWANGDVYQGDFVDGEREGKGILRKADGQVYDGEFKNDAKNGAGVEKYKSGQQFVGQFRNGERFKGTLKTKNGTQINVTSQ